MNVGDYCRTLKGIVKIAKIEDGVMTDTKGYLHYGDFIKSSPSLIDVLEVGDYVNGDKVVNFMLNNNLRAGVIVDSSHYGYDFDEIKSILTKEMFEQMEYKIQ